MILGPIFPPPEGFSIDDYPSYDLVFDTIDSYDEYFYLAGDNWNPDAVVYIDDVKYKLDDFRDNYAPCVAQGTCKDKTVEYNTGFKLPKSSQPYKFVGLSSNGDNNLIKLGDEYTSPVINNIYRINFAMNSGITSFPVATLYNTIIHGKIAYDLFKYYTRGVNLSRFFANCSYKYPLTKIFESIPNGEITYANEMFQSFNFRPDDVKDLEIPKVYNENNELVNIWDKNVYSHYNAFSRANFKDIDTVPNNWK